MKKLLFALFICAFSISHVFAQTPTITSFTPGSGPIGTTVTIAGTNFNSTAANNIVFFGATRATVTGGTTTSLTVTVPVGATYQPITVLSNGLLAYSSKPFITTFTGGGALNVTSFAPKVDLTPGTNPSAVSIGDLDGDGKADLAVGNFNSTAVSLFRNTSSVSSISYAAKVDFIAGTDHFSVSIGDFDGDGKPDMAVTNYSSNTVSVFRNTGSAGSISYASKVDFITGSFPSAVSIGDLDGDGKADLAVTNVNSNTISVFRNTGSVGSISYAAKADFTTGVNPRDVSIGDLDGDGKPELAVTNYSSNTVSIFRNTGSVGSISYATKVDFTTGPTPWAVSIGDLDGDGKADLAVANLNGNNVSILRNTGSIGSINYASTVDFTTGFAPRSVSIGDLDGDGKLDLAVTNSSSNTVSVLRNTGSVGSIGYDTNVDFTTGTNPTSSSIGDLDGDGKADLVVTNSGNNTVSVFRNTVSPPTPPTITSFSPATGVVGTSVTITGTNFDATPSNNIVRFGATIGTVTAATATQLTVVVNKGATYSPISVLVGGLTAYSSTPFIVSFPGSAPIDATSFASVFDYRVGNTPLEVGISDFDRDGNPDIVADNFGSSSFSILRNISVTGTIDAGSFASRVDFSTTSQPAGMAVGDLNGDALPDIVVVDQTNNVVSVFQNTSTPGNISFNSFVNFTAITQPTRVIIVDVDGDDKPDLVTSAVSGFISVFRNTTTSGPISSSSFAAKVDFSAGSADFLTAGDIDGDTKPDIIVSNNFGNSIYIFQNASTPGSFTTSSLLPKVNYPIGAGGSPFGCAVGDLDLDGKIDIAFTNVNNSSISVLRNISAPGTLTTTSLATRVDYASGSSPRKIAIGDLNGDGKPDIASVNFGNSVSVYQNTSSPGSITISSFSAKVDFGASPGPQGIAIGDIDGDGKPEIVVGESGSLNNKIGVLRNAMVTLSVPTITSVAPGSGTTNTPVTIIGTNFDPTPSNNIVKFNGTTAIVTASTTTSITTTVPPSATSGAISVTVGANTATSPASFCVIPPAPVSAVNAARCGSGIVTLSVSGGTNGLYRWYTVSNGGVAIAGEINDSYTTGTLLSTTSYYVSVNNGTCESNRTPATATVNLIPTPPLTTQGSSCGPSASVTVTASGGLNGQYRWYTTALGGTASSETNANFTSPTLTASTTYYVSINNGVCESTRTAVLAEIKLCIKAPEITVAETTVPIEGKTSINLKDQTATFNGPLDIASIQVIKQPISGAKATINTGILTLDYAGISFSGLDILSIKACDFTPTCTTAEVKIDVVGDISIFNAVSANDDNKNDIFFIQYIDIIPETKNNKVTIFNRWGDNVFETDNYDNVSKVFRGQNNSGNDLPSGTYFYKIDFVSGLKTRMGYLALRR